MTKIALKYFFLFTLIHQLCISECFSQEAYFDTITCINNPEVSYSVYQPDGFLHGKMIYILDPAGRSELAISKFKLIADQLNIMLVCSENSKNGPIDNNISIFNAVFSDSKERYAFDTSNVILSGFSGGSRAAFRISTYNKNKVFAMIGCGAGLPSNIKISSDLEFNYAGITGITDMNFYEMLNLDTQIKNRSNKSNIFFFSGGHSWPPDSVLLLAARWVIFAGNKNESSIDDLFNLYQTIIDQNKQYFEPWVKAYQLEALIESLHDESDTKTISDELLAIQLDPTFKKKSKSFEDYRSVFLDETTEIVDEIGKIKVSNLSDIPLEPISWWTSKIQMINGFINSKSLEKRNMGLRLQDFLWRNCYEQGAISYNESEYTVVMKFDDIMKQIKPESYIPWIRSANCYVKTGDHSMALNNLKNAVQRGFSNKTYLKNNFESLSSERGYQKILEDLNE